MLANDVHCDVMMLSEIWNPSIPYVKINNYHEIVIKTRQKLSGGGVGLYIRSNLLFSMNQDVNKMQVP